jgi:hypothetical protein
MKRYALLRETDGQHLPVGIAVERDNDVTIVAIDEFGLPRRISEPYEVLQRDLSTVQYRPGDQGYFEQVLLELQRIVSVGEKQNLPSVEADALIELYNDEVARARLAAPRVYAPRRSTVSAWNSAVERVAGFRDAGGAFAEPVPRVAA